jgi:hypothetical protein
MQYATDGERWYARKLVRNLLSRGLSVSVNDGEEWTVVRSRKEGEVLEALATTDMDELIASDDAGTRLGWFQLIWGNDEDGSELIADHTSNALCETIWHEVHGGGDRI